MGPPHLGSGFQDARSGSPLVCLTRLVEGLGVGSLIYVRRSAATGVIRAGRDLWLVLATLTPTFAVLAGVGLLALFRDSPIVGAATTALAVSLFAIGIVLLAEPGQARTGVAMIFAAVLLVASWANEWQVGPLPLLSQVVGPTWFVAAGWALYRYPDEATARGDRWIFGVMLAWVVVTPWLTTVVSLPEWYGFAPGAWWPTLWPNLHALILIQDVANVGNVVLLVLYALVWAGKLARSKPGLRRLKAPTGVAAIFAGALVSLVPIGSLLGFGDPEMNVVYAVSALGTLAVPTAFLVCVLRRLLARAAVAELVLHLHARPTPDEVVHVLRQALKDPSAQIAYWSAADSVYLLPTWEPLASTPDARTLVVDVAASDGKPLARVRTDPLIVRDGELVAATVAAFSLSLENALLLATTQAQLRELQAASARTVQAADAERRRIEQNLHDGAQQKFLALGLQIATAEATMTDPSGRQALGVMRSQLQDALADLRELAQGLNPPALRLGLAAAVHDATRHYPFDVELQLPAEKLPETTSLTAYYAICEAVANAAKHASATRVSVCGSVDDGHLSVLIVDDGRGGAHVGTGRGLDGIVARVTALGGISHLHSPPGVGTTLRLRIPCV